MVLVIDVCASAQELLDEALVALLRREYDGRVAVLVLAVHQRLHLECVDAALQVAPARSNDELLLLRCPVVQRIALPDEKG